MVSGFKISPNDLSNISSGESNPIVMELNDCDNLEAGLFENNNFISFG
jgi:hypothetical protein